MKGINPNTTLHSSQHVDGCDWYGFDCYHVLLLKLDSHKDRYIQKSRQRFQSRQTNLETQHSWLSLISSQNLPKQSTISREGFQTTENKTAYCITFITTKSKPSPNANAGEHSSLPQYNCHRETSKARIHVFSDDWECWKTQAWEEMSPKVWIWILHRRGNHLFRARGNVLD